MIHFHENGIKAIEKAFAGATEGLICTPYYSERGLKLLDPFFTSADKVEFWTRFSPLDWRAGVADMAALKRRVQLVLNRGKKFNISVSDNLHAKIYSFSNNKVIIGSANLTWPAMTTNIETICELTNADAISLLSLLPKLKSRLTAVPIDVFVDYVTIAVDAISKPSEGPAEEDEDMNAAIALAEDTLRDSLVQKAPKAPSILPLEIEGFFKYCRREKTDLASEIIDRGLKGKHSLQGHVKHCYYGALQFLTEHPQFVDEIAVTQRESFYNFENQDIRTTWVEFLREHADEIDEKRKFYFHTLRVYIPENLGGICSGGGGASSTLKRVLPLVARMLQGTKRKK